MSTTETTPASPRVSISLEFGDPDRLTHLRIADPQGDLLAAAADRSLTRAGMAEAYRRVLNDVSRERVNWRTVNEAIVKRWSASALEHIKREAWRQS